MLGFRKVLIDGDLKNFIQEKFIEKFMYLYRRMVVFLRTLLACVIYVMYILAYTTVQTDRFENACTTVIANSSHLWYISHLKIHFVRINKVDCKRLLLTGK